jgi:hypothetical protein
MTKICDVHVIKMMASVTVATVSIPFNDIIIIFRCCRLLLLLLILRLFVFMCV